MDRTEELKKFTCVGDTPLTLTYFESGKLRVPERLKILPSCFRMFQRTSYRSLVCIEVLSPPAKVVTY